MADETIIVEIVFKHEQQHFAKSIRVEVTKAVLDSLMHDWLTHYGNAKSTGAYDVAIIEQSRTHPGTPGHDTKRQTKLMIRFADVLYIC